MRTGCDFTLPDSIIENQSYTFFLLVNHPICIIRMFCSCLYNALFISNHSIEYNRNSIKNIIKFNKSLKTDGSMGYNGEM